MLQYIVEVASFV